MRMFIPFSTISFNIFLDFLIFPSNIVDAKTMTINFILLVPTFGDKSSNYKLLGYKHPCDKIEIQMSMCQIGYITIYLDNMT